MAQTTTTAMMADDVDAALGGEDAAEDGGRLTGEDEAEQHGRLGEDEQADERVGLPAVQLSRGSSRRAITARRRRRCHVRARARDTALLS